MDVSNQALLFVLQHSRRQRGALVIWTEHFVVSPPKPTSSQVTRYVGAGIVCVSSKQIYCMEGKFFWSSRSREVGHCRGYGHCIMVFKLPRGRLVQIKEVSYFFEFQLYTETQFSVRILATFDIFSRLGRSELGLYWVPGNGEFWRPSLRIR
ncbi:hypothetical protein BDV18DRAFT_46189 [Aspergillus unguis]